MQHNYGPVTDKELTSLWTARLEVIDNRAYGRVTVPKIKHFLKSTEDIYARATGYIGQCIEFYNRNQYADYQGKYFSLDRPSGFAYRSVSDSVEALRLLRVQSNQSLWFRNPWSGGFVGMLGLETLKLDTNFQTFYNYPRPYYDSILEWKLEHANYTVQKLADGSERRLGGLYFDGYEDRVRLEPTDYFQKLAEENKNNPAKFFPDTNLETRLETNSETNSGTNLEINLMANLGTNNTETNLGTNLGAELGTNLWTDLWTGRKNK